MGRLRLIIADYDADYLAKFEKFLIVNYPQRFDILSFSSADKLYGYTENSNPKGILLINNCMVDRGRALPRAEAVILLTGDGGEPVPQGIAAVDKYRHADSLVADMLRIYAQQSCKPDCGAGLARTRVIGLTSPSGGAGKTSIAVACSRICAGRGLKTLYLNLEPVASTNLFFQGNMEQNMSNVFYYLKGSCSNLALKLEGARCCDFDTGVYFFNPPDSIAEWEEITADDISRLVRTLQSSGVYDAVFVDLPGAVDSRSAAVFKAADRILLIQGCDLVASARARVLEAGMGILEKKYNLSLAEKVTTVLNRCHPDYGMFDAGTLPDRPFVKIEECAAARKASSVSALVEDTMFLSDINGLLELIFTGDAMWTALSGNAFPKESPCGGECIA